MADGLVIVAIPSRDEDVWKVSSEKVPHLTLLYLDRDLVEKKRKEISEFVEHAVKTVLSPFHLEVERRGTLGDDDADVLFFNKRFASYITHFRNSLLKDPNIKTAYDSVTQYPEWTPHLTLGYPKAPANDKALERPYLGYVRFDKIEIWYGEYGGESILIPNEDYSEVAMMSDLTEITQKGEAFLQHHGVKGMKWGVRKDRPNLGSGSVARAGKKAVGAVKARRAARKAAKTPSADAAAAKSAKKKMRKGGIGSLSNNELRTLSTRMQLERQVKSLNPSPSAKAAKFVTGTLAGVAKQSVSSLAKREASKMGKRALGGR